jgi:hypothetical protein
MAKKIPDFGTYTDEDFAALIVAAIEDAGPEVRDLVAAKLDELDLCAWTDAFSQEVAKR